MPTNRAIALAAHPAGFPKDSDFKLVELPAPKAGPGQFVVRTKFVSVDPYMRGRMTGIKTYVDPFEIGKPIAGGAVGEVIESNNPDFPKGQAVLGMWGWQDHHVSDGRDVQKLDPRLAPISTALGILGMPGMTAYFGFLEICKPKAGETAYISGAAGAVGAIVGQIAKIKGCRVVGSAGSDEKVAYLLKECGYDDAFNYKTEKNFAAKIRELCPKGVDCYFDNVGGEMTDAVFANLANFARISICGVISQYNLDKPDLGPRATYATLLVRQARAEGFIVSRFMQQWPEGIKQMGQWLKEGKLKYREDILDGLENTPKAFIRMLRGENKGKQLVKVS
jgi:hypothetical protein